MVFSAQWAAERANWICSERVQCAPKRVCVCFFTCLCCLDSFYMVFSEQANWVCSERAQWVPKRVSYMFGVAFMLFSIVFILFYIVFFYMIKNGLVYVLVVYMLFCIVLCCFQGTVGC